MSCKVQKIDTFMDYIIGGSVFTRDAILYACRCDILQIHHVTCLRNYQDLSKFDKVNAKARGWLLFSNPATDQ